MQATVFYSWQSDSDNKVNRNFIQSALETAIKQLKRNEDVLSAMRDDSSIELDKDTQGVPGSPPIVDTILKKISQAAVFVPDLTIIGQSSAGRKLPNPNVLIEYGWALNALGNHRIVPVINTAVVKVKPEEMPFDIRHIRYPITYCLSETDDLEQRKKVKAELAKDLERALAVVFKQMPAEDVDANVFAAQPETFSPSAFWAKDETFSSENQRLSIPDGPMMFLRLIPNKPLSLIETSKQVLDLITSASLQPMNDGNKSVQYCRNKYGAFSFSIASDLTCGNEGEVNLIRRLKTVRWLSHLFKTGEIWGVDCFTLDPEVKTEYSPELDSGFFPGILFEDILIRTLDNYLKFAREELRLSLPLKLIVGATDVQGFKMKENTGFRSYQFKGNIVKEDLIKEMVIDDCEVSSQSILMPFFKYVWEECGLDRPDKESLK